MSIGTRAIWTWPNGGHSRAPSHLAVRRRLRHFESAVNTRHSRSRGARTPQCHLGDGGGAELSRARRRCSLDTLNSATPRVAIGLHLALTAPFRPLSKSFKPVQRGRLPAARGDGAAARHATASTTPRWWLRSRASCRSFVDTFGRAPDFVDGHQHVHLLAADPRRGAHRRRKRPRRMPGCANAAGWCRSRQDLPTARDCFSTS